MFRQNNKNHHPTSSNNKNICIDKIEFIRWSYKCRFRHKNHHPTCPNNEDIENIAFHGGHFEIQDGGQIIHR